MPYRQRGGGWDCVLPLGVDNQICAKSTLVIKFSLLCVSFINTCTSLQPKFSKSIYYLTPPPPLLFTLVYDPRNFPEIS